LTFLPLYNIFLFHTPHPHKGDGLTAVPFVFCFFNHPPARIPPHCAHYSAVRMHQHTNPDHCCTHSNERGQPGKTACRKTPAPPPPALTCNHHPTHSAPKHAAPAAPLPASRQLYHTADGPPRRPTPKHHPAKAAQTPRTAKATRKPFAPT
jgi:hypothetical protein